MELFSSIYNNLIDNINVNPYVIWGFIALLIITFSVQLYYYLGIYAKLPHFRNNKGTDQNETVIPISVIVVLRENSFYFVEAILPKLLTQNHPQYEIIVVDCSYSEQIGEIAEALLPLHKHLHITRIQHQSHITHSTKLALTVGIKAAQYEHLIFTTADCSPSSDRWLSIMAKGFLTADIVIGYCGIEIKKGFINKLIRSSRAAYSVRYLASAVRGRTYRGIMHNLGYSKSIYFKNKGFNHLNMNIGDDDLFINKIAHNNNVSIVMNQGSTLRQIQSGGWSWWKSLQLYYSYTFKYFPADIKLYITGELVSRVLFMTTAIVAAILLPLWWKIFPLTILLVRYISMIFVMLRINRRLGERKLMWVYVIYDLIAPISEFLLSMNRIVKKNNAIWR